MPVLVVGTEKNFTALRPRLFARRVSMRDVREAAAAIRAANPNVNLDRLAPGIVLTIPEGVGARVSGDLSLDQSVPEAIDALAAEAGTVLDELVSAAKARAREEASERRSLAKALRSKEVQAAMRGEPALKRDVEAVRKAVDDEEAAAKERLAGVERARTEWLAEIDGLRALLNQRREKERSSRT
jgi:hypothetical protein